MERMSSAEFRAKYGRADSWDTLEASSEPPLMDSATHVRNAPRSTGYRRSRKAYGPILRKSRAEGLPEILDVIESEFRIYERVASYMREYHPDTEYHFDLSGNHNPSKVTRALYSRLNGRSWPDMELSEPRLCLTKSGERVWHHGAYFEIKITGTKLKRKKDSVKIFKGDYKLRKAGDWWDLHIEEQAMRLESLRRRGYYAEFTVGYEDTIGQIEKYLSGALY